jgi:hypothetical protein
MIRSMTSIALAPAARAPLWRYAQWTGVSLTGVLLAGLVVSAEATLHILWDMVIPLLPAVFLVSPLLWRNVCPLATLNTVVGERFGSRSIGGAFAVRASLVGIALLALLVPARRFLFNVNGAALAVTIVLVALAALNAGLVFARRAGFCNAICPVLPVEKLYGQAPLLQIGTARCSTCSVCTPAGCIELARSKTVAQTLGRARREDRWLHSPFGVFAAAFPGFIIGYFTTQNGSTALAWSVYSHVALYALASYSVVVAAAWTVRLPSAIEMLLLGGSSFALYYWLAAPALAKAYGVPTGGLAVIRVTALALAAAWLWRAVMQTRTQARAGAPRLA